MHKNHCNNCNCNNNIANEYEGCLEDSCSNIENTVDLYNNDCHCGFDDYSPFPDNPVLGQSYVPRQIMNTSFIPCVGLKMGTIYPELVSPYMPGQSMAEIEYLSRSNTIGEGCNR